MSRVNRRVKIGVLAAAVTLTAPAAAGGSLQGATGAAKAPAAQLERTQPALDAARGTITRFQQEVGGLPVHGAELVIADPVRGPAITVADNTVAGLGPARASSAIGEPRAISAAREELGVERLRSRAGAKLGVDPRSGRVAWEVSLPARLPLGDFIVTVDALSAEVLAVDDVLHRATGTAAVFEPNPVVTQGSYAGLKDRRDRDSAQLTSLRLEVPLERITSPKGCLSGIYADARLGKKAKPVCREGLNFTGVTRADDAFEAVMAYYHVDRTRAYVDSLGLSKALRSKPQKVRANGIPDDNSYYSSLSNSMTLGTGGVDDGEDADVIVHEYGHSLQEQAVKNYGRSTDAGAIGEGFGDYVAAMMSSLTTGGGTAFDTCIFDWDGISYSKTGCGRRADKSLTLRKAEARCFGSIHCIGETWSSGLYELRTALGADSQGRSVMDRVVLESNFLLTAKTSFREAARALIAADQLLYAGAHAPAIEAEMIERSICKAAGC